MNRPNEGMYALDAKRHGRVSRHKRRSDPLVHHIVELKVNFIQLTLAKRTHQSSTHYERAWFKVCCACEKISIV